jgi:hypothetical protein
MGKITITLSIDRDVYDTCMKLMSAEIVDDDGRKLYKACSSSKNAWFTEIISLGNISKVRELDERKKQYEAKDG